MGFLGDGIVRREFVSLAPVVVDFGPKILRHAR
jgi:hypothetical protein